MCCFKWRQSLCLYTFYVLVSMTANGHSCMHFNEFNLTILVGGYTIRYNIHVSWFLRFWSTESWYCWQTFLVGLIKQLILDWSINTSSQDGLIVNNDGCFVNNGNHFISKNQEIQEILLVIQIWENLKDLSIPNS